MRKIEQKMIDFIDQKLASYGAAQLAIKNKKARNLLVYAAEACVGIREEGGNNQGAMVELFQETIGSANKEAWCMSFVQTLIAYVEHKTGIISPIHPSEHCLTVYKNTPRKQRVQRFPAPGAIAIWQHGTSSNGHTGLMMEWQGLSFESIEGNTEAGLSEDGSVVREGGGVYQTNRHSKRNGTMAVVGFLIPF